MTKDKKEMLFRLGVEARLVALEEEKKELRALLGGKGESGSNSNHRGPYKKKTKTGRKPMSAALKKAIGARMRRMWKEKREGTWVPKGQ